MRLACPNCDARYEVPDGAIPESGRDVQCSNCGHAWFQLPDGPDEEADEDARAPAPAPEPEPEPAPQPAPQPARAQLDDSVLSILREEAEREAEARRHEVQRAAARRAEAEAQLQTQPELGLSELGLSSLGLSAPTTTPAATPGAAPAVPAATALSAAAATDRRLKMLQGEDPDAAPATVRPPARRDLLPNVDDINSTLQPEDSRASDAQAEALPDLTRGPAFRSGFVLAVFVLVVAGVIYLAAPAIQATVPALKAPLDGYVGFVDGLRARLDALMNSATDKLNGDPG